MIVFGWGSGTKRLGDGFFATCTNCHNTLQFVIVEASKKITVYWLPVVKWDRQYFCICPICSHGLQLPSKELAQRIVAGAFCDPYQPSPALYADLRKAYSSDSSASMSGQDASVVDPVRSQPTANRHSESVMREGPKPSKAEVVRPTVQVVEPAEPAVIEPVRVNHESALTLPIVATLVVPAKEQHKLITVEASGPEPDPVIMRVDGTSSCVTLKEHQRRGWKEATRCDFSNMDIRGVSFAGANLDGAKLDGSDFAGCDFSNALLKNVSGKGCNFEGADFAGAQLINVEFQNSNLNKATFCAVSGSFESAVIDQVNFGCCNLTDAVFVRVLQNASQQIATCRFKSSDFSESDMSRCDLQGIDFRTCTFTGTNLSGTLLKRCNFEGVDLASANLIGADLLQVTISDGSKFPGGIVVPIDVKNVDVVRKVQEETRKTWLTLVVVAIVLCTIIAVAAISKTPPTTIESSETEPDTRLDYPWAEVPRVETQRAEAARVAKAKRDDAQRVEELPAFTNTIGMYFKVLPSSRSGISSFSLGVYEVTQTQYKAVMGVNPSTVKGANNPVETVNWHEAVAFCAKLSALPAERAAGRVYRLPTESEWEYACCAGTTTAYSFGDDAKNLGKYAWFRDNSSRTSHAVGGKLPNSWGLYDMHGNVWEWCEANLGSFRVYRGGGWDDREVNCRTVSRSTNSPTFRGKRGGFRVVLSSQSGQSPEADK